MTSGESLGSKVRRHSQQLTHAVRLRGGVLLLVVVLLVIAGGMVASYSLSTFAKNESAVAIDTFDLHGDLGTISGDLSLPQTDRTAAINSDITSAISGGLTEISEIRANKGNIDSLTQAINASETYIKLAAQQLASTQHGGSGVTIGSTSLALMRVSVGDRVDNAGAQAEVSAQRAASEVRTGGVISLLLVVIFVVIGVLWLARMVQAAHARARVRFEAMIENSSDLSFLTGDDHQTQYCSPSAARFFGISPAEVCETSLEELVHPDDLGRASDAFAAVASTGVAGPLRSQGSPQRRRLADAGVHRERPVLSFPRASRRLAHTRRHRTQRPRRTAHPSGFRRSTHWPREPCIVPRPTWSCPGTPEPFETIARGSHARP